MVLVPGIITGYTVLLISVIIGFVLYVILVVDKFEINPKMLVLSE